MSYTEDTWNSYCRRVQDLKNRGYTVEEISRILQSDVRLIREVLGDDDNNSDRSNLLFD